MLVMVFDNPEPANLERKDVNVEIRIMLKGMSEDEGERLGQALYDLSRSLRPAQKPFSFITETEEVKSG
jgi:hypothetical protein